MTVSGIYRIQSKANPGRIYIGSSINIPKRWEQHLFKLSQNKHHSQKLQRHFNKYGKNDLVFSIVLECHKEDLITTEQYFLDAHKPYFNGSLKAQNNGGFKHTDKAKSKISEAFKGEKNPNYGRKFSAEHRAKLSSSMKGRKSPNKGKSLSEETRNKISENNKGKKHSPLTEFKKGSTLSEGIKKKISAALKGKPTWNKGKFNPHKGYPCSEENREKKRIATTGKKHSPETKKKMSEWRTNYYMKKRLLNIVTN